MLERDKKKKREKNRVLKTREKCNGIYLIVWDGNNDILVACYASKRVSCSTDIVECLCMC